MTDRDTIDNIPFMRFLNKLVWASIPVLFTLGGWVGAQVLDHETRITVIEGSRYSREDGAREREERIAADTSIRFEILDTLKSIEKRLDALERN